MLDSPGAGRLLPVSLQDPCGARLLYGRGSPYLAAILSFVRAFCRYQRGALSPHPPGVALTGRAHEV